MESYISIDAKDGAALKKVLVEWGLEEYFEKFVEEGITLEILPYIIEDKATVEGLVPKIGKRFQLINRVKQYFQTQISTGQDKVVPQSDETSSSVYSIPSISSVSSFSGAPSQCEIDNTILFTDATEVEKEPSTSVIIYSEDFLPHTSKQNSNITEQSLEEPLGKKPKTLNNFLTNFDLQTTLKSSAIGKALLNWYSVKGGFDSARQGYLVDIIVSEFLNNGFSHLSNCDYSVLSKKIVELFPCEIVEAYYLAPIRKRDSIDNKPGLAKGKLVDKFRNKLTFLREAKILPSRQLNADNEIPIEDLEQDDSFNNHVLWLRHNREPLIDVYAHWGHTFLKRRQQILKEGGDCKEIFLEYPILVEPICLTLIDKDFEKIYPEKSNVFSTWDPVFQNLMSLRKQYITLDTDKVLADLLQSTETLDDNYKTFLMFGLLPSLLPNRSRHVYGKSRKHWKPTIADSRNGIILRVDLAADIECAINNKKEKLATIGIPLQPHVIVEVHGTKVQQVYVYIHQHFYKVSTVLKAIDICFKAYHVFHLKYQMESEHIWFFIQRVMYNIKTKWDSPSPNILDIVNKIKIDH